MKHLVTIGLCILIGFVLGRWAPSNELRYVREELRIAQESGARSPFGAHGTVSSATTFLRIDQEDAAQTPDAPDIAEKSVSETPGDQEPDETPPDEPDAVDEEDERRSFKDRIDAAKEGWRVRADLARMSFLENLGATDEEAARFDVLIGAMNLRLESTINEWVQQVTEKEVIRAEDGARLMHALTGSIVLTYDEMDRSFTENWRDATDPEFMLYDFVDPSVADSLIDAEELIRERER